MQHPQSQPDSAPEADLDSTARINRRGSVLAQIEAALLAGRLGLSDEDQRATGADPYNRGRGREDAWGGGHKR